MLPCAPDPDGIAAAVVGDLVGDRGAEAGGGRGEGWGRFTDLRAGGCASFAAPRTAILGLGFGFGGGFGGGFGFFGWFRVRCGAIGAGRHRDRGAQVARMNSLNVTKYLAKVAGLGGFRAKRQDKGGGENCRRLFRATER